jgi:hypothetical protein
MQQQNHRSENRQRGKSQWQKWICNKCQQNNRRRHGEAE